MSKELGEAALNELINRALENNPTYKALQENYRKTLNSKVHILDISRESLKINLKNNTPEEIDLFNNSYEEFIDLVYTSASQVFPILESLKEIPKGVTFIENPPVLINASFDAARKFITEKISRVIPDNPYFGISNRVRTLAEYLALGYTKQELESMGKYFNAKGLEKLSQYSKFLNLKQLSVLDIGHTYLGEENSGRESPLGSKLESALKISEPNSTIKSLVQTALNDLVSLQASCDYTFKNNLPEGLSKKGYLVLTLHFYKKNGEFAKVESSIYSKIINDIKAEIVKEIMDIPGSNTMRQDATEQVKKLIVDSIKGSKSPDILPKHSLLSNTVNNKPANKPIKLSKSEKVSITQPKIPIVRRVTDTLTSLQALINQHLQSVISANMGDGSSRNVLNYRTGRFAASAAVERMTQSRAGMITAFYTYMKNPYQTFEPGYRQGSPKSRDPKLLISKSIREIAAEKVGNRLRAVLV